MLLISPKPEFEATPETIARIYVERLGYALPQKRVDIVNQIVLQLQDQLTRETDVKNEELTDLYEAIENLTIKN